MTALKPSDLPFRFDAEACAYLIEIIEAMMTRFGITREEAIARIAHEWSHVDAIIGEDLMYHELPSYWAHHFYFGKASFWWVKPEVRATLNLPDLKPLPLPEPRERK